MLPAARRSSRRLAVRSCHRVGTNGETMGPDLTAVARRFQREGDPRVDRLPVARDQRSVRRPRGRRRRQELPAGLSRKSDDGRVTVLQSNGRRSSCRRTRSTRSSRASVSAMPSGAAQSAHAGTGGGSVRVPRAPRLQRHRPTPSTAVAESRSTLRGTPISALCVIQVWRSASILISRAGGKAYVPRSVGQVSNHSTSKSVR